LLTKKMCSAHMHDHRRKIIAGTYGALKGPVKKTPCFKPGNLHWLAIIECREYWLSRPADPPPPRKAWDPRQARGSQIQCLLVLTEFKPVNPT
jgi:hypothetical protein